MARSYKFPHSIDDSILQSFYVFEFHRLYQCVFNYKTGGIIYLATKCIRRT